MTFHLSADNPNGPNGEYEIDFGDGHGVGVMPQASCNGPPEDFGKTAHGPWDPPPKLPVHMDYDADNSYAPHAQPGTYTATATVHGTDAGCNGLPNAYKTQGSATVTVTVTRPPVTTTMTTAGN